jgi:hypothetical protein
MEHVEATQRRQGEPESSRSFLNGEPSWSGYGKFKKNIIKIEIL